MLLLKNYRFCAININNFMLSSVCLNDVHLTFSFIQNANTIQPFLKYCVVFFMFIQFYTKVSNVAVIVIDFNMFIDLYIPRGQTLRLTARLRALPADTERSLLANDGGLLDQAVQDVFNSPLLNLREGSIYLLLNISKDKSFELRQTETKTMTTLVRKMLQSDKVKNSITEKTSVLVEIDELDEDTFLNETFGKQ